MRDQVARLSSLRSGTTRSEEALTGALRAAPMADGNASAIFSTAAHEGERANVTSLHTGGRFASTSSDFFQASVIFGLGLGLGLCLRFGFPGQSARASSAIR